MKATVQHSEYGLIDYEESAWTGKKELAINGVKLQKHSKNTFILDRDGEKQLCQIKGNFITGTTLNVGQDVIALLPAAKVYEIVCSVAILMLILVWGNSVPLCSIIPVVGGVIGGAISGAMACLNLLLMKKTKNVGIKLSIWLVMLAATFFICALIGRSLLLLLR